MDISYQITFLKDSSGARPGILSGDTRMEDHGDQDQSSTARLPKTVCLKIRQLLCFVQQNTHPTCACDFGLFPKPSLRLWETLGLPPLSPAQSLGSLLFMSTERLPEKTGSCPPGGVWCPARPVVCVLVSVVTRGAACLDRVSGQHAVRVPAVPTHKTHALSTHSCRIFFHRVRI